MKGQRTSITIKIINGEVTNKAVVVKRLRVSSGNGDSHDWLELPDTYTKKYLPVGKEDVATPSKLKKWKHLERVINWSKLRKRAEPIGIIPSKNDEPYAFKTKLDWCIVYPVNGTSRKEKCCNRIGVRQADEIGKHFF